MGNSMSILTKCLPSEPTEEAAPGEESEKHAAVLKQKKELAPKPMEEDEDWGEFPDDFEGEDRQPKTDLQQKQLQLKTGPLSASRDNILPLSSPTKSPSKGKELILSHSFEKEETPTESNPSAPSSPMLKPFNEELKENEREKSGRISITQAPKGIPSTKSTLSKPSEPLVLSKSQPKEIPQPKPSLAQKSKPVRSPKMAEEKQDSGVEQEIDFFSDLTVKYVPPKKAEKNGKEITNSNTTTVLPPLRSEPTPTRRVIEVEEEKEEEEDTQSSLTKMKFLEEKDEGIEESEGGGWGNDDFADVEEIEDDEEVFKVSKEEKKEKSEESSNDQEDIHSNGNNQDDQDEGNDSPSSGTKGRWDD